MRNRITQRLATATMILLGLCSVLPAAAAPGSVLFSDGFERNQLVPWTTTNGVRSGILTGGAVSNGGTRGLFTRHNVVTVTSPTFSTAVPAAELSIWVRRGSDAFSEDPDGGEDLLLEYRRANGTWGLIRSYPGGGIAGEIFSDTSFLPPDALHATFAIRLRQTNGSNVDFDYFHIDDIVVTERAGQAVLDVGACDDFSSGLSTNWTANSAGGNAGTSGVTFQSPSASLFTNGGAVSVTSNVIDTSVPEFDSVSLWVRRGADAFSENPDGSENLIIEYLDSASNWVQLESFVGGGTAGQIFLRNYAIPLAGRHAGFQLRIRQTSGSGPTFDFWHVDDVCLDTRALPSLSVSKIVTTLSDPINGTTNPLAIPGAFVQYTISVQNNGAGAIDDGSVVIRDALVPETALFVDTTAGDPIAFVDGAATSGLSYVYATGVTFSNQPGGVAPFDYVPTADGQGVDPAVTGVRVQLAGAMNGATAGATPSFQLLLRARID